MRQSQLVTRTSKQVSSEEVSINAQLLTRAGFVQKLMAGVYSMLPLGTRVLQKIENVVRDEMGKLGGQEILMPALQPKDIWVTTGRWDAIDVLFKLKGSGDRDLALGPTHEEVVTPLVASFVDSYRDLPVSVFQIQTKFRNEARAKSGLLRGREFRMKDLYSFHTTQACLDEFYDRATEAYHNVFRRCGLGERTVFTAALGGAFSRFSHEFQTLTPYGEDQVYQIPGTDVWVNHEILADPTALSDLGIGGGVDTEALVPQKAIEVGNIFKLGTRFSDACGLTYSDEQGARKPVIMGCYGIGSSRVMGTVVEVLHDERGMQWPQEIAPYEVHLISLARSEQEAAGAEELYHKLMSAGIEVLFDDRPKLRAGEKFADADLIGLPHRVVFGSKTLESGQLEWKRRASAEASFLPFEKLVLAVRPA